MTKERQLFYMRRLLFALLVLLAIEILRLVLVLSLPVPTPSYEPTRCLSYSCPA